MDLVPELTGARLIYTQLFQSNGVVVGKAIQMEQIKSELPQREMVYRAST